MSAAKEHLEPLLRELARADITPDVSRTRGGHLRLRWKANGNIRSVLASFTPSDHRSMLNARSRIRAYLREDGLLDRPKAKPAPLAKALSLPAPREPDNVRIARMENDIEALLDLLHSITEKLTEHGIKLGDNIVGPVEVLPPPPPPKPVKAKTGDCSWEHDFLLCVEYQPTPLELIVKRSGVTYGNASVRLTALRKRGLVENVARGVWRKTRERNGNGIGNGVGAHHGIA